jgi:outer membrane protein assembly factor BamB
MKNIISILFISCLLVSSSFFTISALKTKKEIIEENVIDDETSSILSKIDWWPMFRHDPAHKGYSTSLGPETNSIKWIYNSGAWIRSSPAIVDGKVYFANYNSDVFCLEMETGKFVWKTNIGYQWMFSSPAVVDGKVFIGSDSDYIYCLDAYTGEILWEFFTTAVRRADCSPTVVNNRVYIGSTDDNLYCIDADSGDQIWKYNLGGNVYSSPAVVNDKVYVGATNGKFYCLDANTKEEIWQKTFFDEIESSPTVVDDKVYIGTNDGFYCCNANTGGKIWTYDIKNLYHSSPAYYDKKIYIGAWANVHCLDAETGELLWKKQVDSERCTSPGVADGKVYVGSQNINCGHITCLDAITGEELWDYTTAGRVSSSPSIVNGEVFVGCNNGRLYCFGDSQSQNNPPNIPIITGPDTINKWNSYDYTFTVSDPDGDNVYIYIDWGVEYGQLPYWHGPFESGKEYTLSRSYDEEGTYTIKARVRDSSFAESEWGIKEVSLSREKSKFFHILNLFSENSVLIRLFSILT